MLRAALRDLQWRWKRFVIAMVGVALVFAMGLIMTGLETSFSTGGRPHTGLDRRRALGRGGGCIRPVQLLQPDPDDRRGRHRWIAGDGASPDRSGRGDGSRHHRDGGRARRARRAAGVARRRPHGVRSGRRRRSLPGASIGDTISFGGQRLPHRRHDLGSKPVRRHPLGVHPAGRRASRRRARASRWPRRCCSTSVPTFVPRRPEGDDERRGQRRRAAAAEVGAIIDRASCGCCCGSSPPSSSGPCCTCRRWSAHATSPCSRRRERRPRRSAPASRCRP